MSEAADYTPQGLSRRGRTLIFCGILAVAAIGYVVGLRGGVPSGRGDYRSAAKPTAHPADSDVVRAFSYDEVGAGALRDAPPSLRWADHIDALRAKPGPPITDEASRLQALALRGERRAFNGAPPVIPHETRGLAEASCVMCHGEAVQLGGQPARAQPHASLTNCRQCHAPRPPTFLTDHAAPTVANDWEGAPAPTQGRRAFPGAPPEVPHTLHMRENCASCHGPHGWPGMQTSHPERTSCLQCHAPTEDRAHPGRALGEAAFISPPKLLR